MSSILKNLQDPSWWFTVFVMAIIVGVAAGFLKDSLERVLSATSSRFGQWRARKVKARKDAVDALAKDPSYLTLAYLRAVVFLLLYLMGTMLYLVAPAFFEFYPSKIFGPHRKWVVWNVILPFLGVFVAYTGYAATSRLSLVAKAVRNYRRRNGLPKLP